MVESKYKTFWRRFGAGLIDGLIFLPLGFIDPWKYSQHIPIFLLVTWFLFHETVWYFYSVLMHGRYGQTLGKMACKIKVIDKSESRPITYRQAIFRDSLLIIVGIILSMNMLPDVLQGKDPYKMTDPKQILFFAFWMSISLLWFAAELITMLTNKKRRAIHDYIASSVVVKLSNDAVHSDAPKGGA